MSIFSTYTLSHGEFELHRGQYVQGFSLMYGLKFNFLVFKISVGQRFFLVLLLVILILVIIVFILDFVGIEILVLVFITLTLHFTIRRLIVSFRVFYRLCFFVLLGHF